MKRCETRFGDKAICKGEHEPVQLGRVIERIMVRPELGERGYITIYDKPED